jgi:hypothetical protein
MWFLHLAFLALCVHAQIFVSPFGSDNNPGTEAAPFKTIPRAQVCCVLCVVDVVVVV